MQRRTFLFGVAGTVCGAATGAHAQLSSRPFRIVVPTSPGSSADISARVVGDRLQIVTGRPVVAENKVGAGGFVATQFVAAADPNGDTIGMFGNSYLHYELDFPQQKFEPLRDVAPVAMIQRGTNVLIVAPESPFKNLGSIIEKARSAPGHVTFASAGPGSSTWHSAERVRIAAGLDLVHVPYKGSPEIIRDIIAGRVDFAFSPISVISSFVASGTIRVLAVSASKRSVLLPDVPTTIEAGVPGSSYNSWTVAVVPSKTPENIQVELNKTFNTVLATPEVSKRFASLGVEVAPMALDEGRAFIREEYADAMSRAKANPAR